MKVKLYLVLFLVFLFFIPLNLISQENTGRILIDVKGFKSDEGKARVLIFSSKSKKGFPSDQNSAFIKKIVEIKNQQIALEFDDIPFGDYAISVHHDKNNDGKVNTNWIGIPKEGLGCSNDAKGNYGPPKFEQAKFTLNSQEKIIKINIVNP